MSSPHRDHISSIFSESLKAADPALAVRSYLSRTDSRLTQRTGTNSALDVNLDGVNAVYVVGCGKAGVPMAVAAHELIGDRVREGIVTVKYGHTDHGTIERIRIDEAGHPEPDEAGRRSCADALALMDRAGAHDLVLALLSGGGSSLWPQPAEPVTLEEKTLVNQVLLASGASIHEMNAVRKHLSKVKGGFAACRCVPAQVMVFAVSDVVGDNLDVIASGPFAPDLSTFADAQHVLDKYGVAGQLPQSALVRLQQGFNRRVGETPRPGDPCFARVTQTVIASNELAVKAAADMARSLGYDVHVFGQALCGEARDAASLLVKKVTEIKGRAGGHPACLVAGGETTVSLGTSPGKGGRNQELALSAALLMVDMQGVTLASLGTDGTDGPTDAAGGVVDSATVAKAAKAGFDPVNECSNHNAYPVLDACGDLVKTGPTGTNVMDIQVVLF